jgi:hypothetical protein
MNTMITTMTTLDPADPDRRTRLPGVKRRRVAHSCVTLAAEIGA